MTKINPLQINNSKTIGLCEGKMEDHEYVGKFDADVLIEWANQVAYNHGHQQVYVYCHKSENPGTSAKSIAASDEYDGEMFTVGVGCEDEDDIKEHLKAHPKKGGQTKCDGCKFMGRQCSILLMSQAMAETLLYNHKCRFKETLPKEKKVKVS